MLTFFKPWRVGTSLRDINASWHETYESHEFTTEQLQIMDNFNLRYECLDERDDFTAQRKALSTLPVFGNDMPNDNYDDPVADSFLESDSTSDDKYQSCESYGPNTLRHMLQMNQMKSLLSNVGWNANSKEEQCTLVPDIYIGTEKDWKQELEKKQQDIINGRDSNNTLKSSYASDTSDDFSTETNMVKIITPSYLSKHFKDFHVRYSILKRKIAKMFNLNKEQERAYMIITNHLTSSTDEQLLMYLGGMAGTGKSQVIKATTRFFMKTRQKHKLALLAPTGSAASIIGGSTYHSFLGINKNLKLSAKRYSSLRSKLEPVKYLFIDEVSMLSCNDLYVISERLAKITGNTIDPFGGYNIIFAGDFAQLPPAMAKTTLYGDVSNKNIGNYKDQQTCLGKVLWHQVTVVVILRQNMRQKTQSTDDSSFRTALENMRYKSCTEHDLAFLNKLSVRTFSDTFQNGNFRNVSIITALNSQRDSINEVGIERFSKDRNETLKVFKSIDSWTLSSANTKKDRLAGKITNDTIARDETVIAASTQNILWSLPPSSTENLCGTLQLCKGLPILVKQNQATECCVTNGAEAIVVDWIINSTGRDNVQSLKTVFVKLINPPQDVQLNGLPMNVVPISAESRTITCTLHDDTTVNITRQQVPIIANFAMTDYASQGRTRPYNVVHLTNCRTHQSYYTCLSRSSTAKGTVIIQGINSRLITGGLKGPASNRLKREFQQLEILDEITKLRYDNHLHSSVLGHRRNTLIKSYMSWKGSNYIPSNMHTSIRWSETDKFELFTDTEKIKYRILDKADNLHKNLNRTVGYKMNRGFIQTLSNSSCKDNDLENIKQSPTMIESEPFQQFEEKDNVNTCQSPTNINKSNTIQNVPYQIADREGMKWDSNNYSCGYDSLFTVIWNIFLDTPTVFKNCETNDFLRSLISSYNERLLQCISLEQIRDAIRTMLRDHNHRKFQLYGKRGVDIEELCSTMLKGVSYPEHQTMVCSHCNSTEMPLNSKHFKNPLITIERDVYENVLRTKFSVTIQDSIHYALDRPIANRCQFCRAPLRRRSTYLTRPQLFLVELQHENVTISDKIIINNIIYHIRGIIYHGDFHFTTRYFDKVGNCWKYDGACSNHNCIYENNVSNIDLTSLNNRQASILIYA